MDKTVHIIDMGCSNIFSVSKMVERIGFIPIIVKNKEELLSAKKIILPGVGSFDSGMKSLYALNLIELLNSKILDEKVPILGICLGMQLFATYSEEGDEKGLNYINGQVKKFNFGENKNKYKIPHMGWNHVVHRKNNLLFKMPTPDTRYYFVHSFHYILDDSDQIIGETEYGYFFPSIINKDNIYGTQFHPEKSHRYGKEIISNFLNKI